MASDPHIRASDEDRDRTATLLREHHAAGRLTPEEFNDRLDQTFAAKTLGDLDELLADLPSIDIYRLPDAGLSRRQVPGGTSHFDALASASAVAGRSEGRLSPSWRAAWGSWLSVTAVLAVIWGLTGAAHGLWFLWFAGPWGAILLMRWITGQHPDSDHHTKQSGYQGEPRDLRRGDQDDPGNPGLPR